MQPEFRELEQAFRGVYRSYRVVGRPRIVPDAFFSSIRKQLIQLISGDLKRLKSARVQTITWIRFTLDLSSIELAFNSRMTEFHKASDIESLVDGMINHMREQIENPDLLNSRFVFDEVLFLDANFHRLRLTRGGSYAPLPKFVESRKAVINPKNQDNECFKWAVIASLHNSEIKCNNNRVTNLRKFESNYDWSDLTFPTSLNNIRKFEFRNSLMIIVLGLEDREIYMCRKGLFRKVYKVVNLLLVSDNDKWHYTAISSLSRLLRTSNSKHKAK